LQGLGTVPDVVEVPIEGHRGASFLGVGHVTRLGEGAAGAFKIPADLIAKPTVVVEHSWKGTVPRRDAAKVLPEDLDDHVVCIIVVVALTIWLLNTGDKPATAEQEH
jgi:hypothetical protein